MLARCLLTAALFYNVVALIDTSTVENRKRCIVKLNVFEDQLVSCNSHEMEAKLGELVEEVAQLRLALASITNAKPKEQDRRVLDCQDVNNIGMTDKGEYTIWPASSPRPFRVYCDMDDGKGWTVFQRRLDGSVDFDRDWSDYREGFGDLSGEHWLGNENLFYLTSGNQRSYELHIVVTDWDGKSFSADYSDFRVHGPNSMYKLTLGEFMGGSAGDSLLHIPKFKIHHEQQFSTYDMDNDGHNGNCAETYHSGWWFNSCFYSNLNGLYQTSGTSPGDWEGVIWSSANGQYSYKSSVMKIRPIEMKLDNP